MDAVVQSLNDRVVIGSLVDGRYRIVRRLGAGGMAEVFEATHTTTRRNVALKLVDLNAVEPAKREAFLARFAREARAAASVSAPHIAQVLDAGKDGETGAPYLAMELLSGEDLRETLKRTGALPETAATKIAAHVCRALVVAHERGIVHRDIKPANLFLHRTENDEICVKLVDFGVAKLLDEKLVDPETSELTRTGTLLGTPHYMSPEQLLQTRTADHRSDLWSLGVVIYKMLAGETPFERAASMGLTVLAICAEPIQPLGERAPWVSQELARIVDACLERDLTRRIGTARELLAALEPLLVDGERLGADELVSLPPELQAQLDDARLTSRRDATGVLRSDAETTALTLSAESGPVDSRAAASKKSASLARWFLLAVIVGAAGATATLLRSEPPRTLESVLGRNELPVSVEVPSAKSKPLPPPSASSRETVPAARLSKKLPRAITSSASPPPKASGVGLRDEFD